MKALSTIE